MRQDESGRWVSDNGRYLWSGSEWLDLEQQDQPTPVAGTSAGAADIGPASIADADADAATPAGRSTSANSSRGTVTSRVAAPRSPRRRRRVRLLVSLLVLVAVVIGAILVVANRSPSRPASAARTPAPGQASPGGLASSPAAPQALDESQRRARAERALVRRADVPGTTEERSATPSDIFLPCRAAPLTPPAGTVLVGQTVSNSDFTVYVGQTVAGYASTRAATEALGQIRDAISRCAPYDYRYANSPRIDGITHTDIGARLDIADGGVYLTEVDTPSNYSGSTTSYSYGYVQRGQFLVRLTLTNASRADRPGLEALMRRLLVPLG
ncbi:MAG TPA: hypothetical protein VLR26_04335 [Frankiaceae bacterium]|nr:hypothetical protein [Frankiaceae bacterium]